MTQTNAPAIFPEVLLYHRVTHAAPDNQYLCVSPENFADHLAILSKERKVLPLYDLIQAGAAGHLVDGGIAITFDDGYADNLINALPLLAKYHCHATIFVTAGLLGHPHGFWYDVLEDVLLNAKNLPSTIYIPALKTTLPLTSSAEILTAHELFFDILKQSPVRMVRLLLHEILQSLGHDSTKYISPHPLLTQEQVAHLAASPWIEIGAHTMHHLVLSSLSASNQHQEIVQSQHALEKITARPVRILAYPYGNSVAYTEETQNITRQAGLLGIANIQGSLSLPVNTTDVPRRLVRNWTAREFHRWLRAADRSALERKTLQGRLDNIYQYLEHSRPLAPVPAMHGVGATTRPMHITHLNTMMGQGGTAKIVQLLLTAQEAAGHDAHILTGKSLVQHPHIHTFDPTPDVPLTPLVQREGLLDYQWQGSHTLWKKPEMQQADILHVHNLHGGYFHPFSLAGLARLHPTVWTLHDMQALTGHCAHAFNCPRWKTGCGLCPHLEIYPKVDADNTHRLWRDKQRVYACAPVHIVCPSHWLAHHVEQSILRQHPLSVIPNGIDTHIFCPQDKAAAREKLGIDPNILVVGSAAYSGPLHNFWKGGDFAMDALKQLCAVHPDVLFLGRGNTDAVQDAHIRLLPYAYDERDMATFYAALDFLLYPSLADNCPLVVQEALACGVPVVTFDVGGIPELVENGQCGIVAPARDGAAFNQAALSLAENPQARSRMGHAARERAVKLFDARLMAQRYTALYDEVREQWQARKQSADQLRCAELGTGIQCPAFMELAHQSNLFTQHTSPPATTRLHTEPISRTFGLDRGTPIDRIYIERFLTDNASCVRGRVLEVADNIYTTQFNHGVTHSDILHATPSPHATLVGDLATGKNIPRGAFDCIILTQTLQFIYNFKDAFKHCLQALAPEGTLLLTASGISQISRYDMDRWGEYWRFTDLSLKRLIAELAPQWTIHVSVYGNCSTAKAFLDGLAAEELPPTVFAIQDPDYQVTVCARITRPAMENTDELD
ncbi:MAG: polysaccharide deacetylase family protein [Desulfovibrionaceae bacterium]